MMSGTSLDGIDAALLDVRPRGDGYGIALLRLESRPYAPELLADLRAALPPESGSTAAVARLHRSIGDAYANLARDAAGGERVDFVAMHGQTLWHDGARGVTLQAGDPFAVREALGATVCYDFRSADCAAGGNGAPLVPYVDRLLFGDAREARVALNLGGIANVTLLPPNAGPDDVVAFDTGPGNMLLDAYVRRSSGGRRQYDRDGTLAAAGRCDAPLLEAMLADEYFALPPPKSTGRERFGEQFLTRHASSLARLAPEDAAATLAELTAASIAVAVRAAGFGGARVLAAGGGTRNPYLMARLRERLGGARVETTDVMGVPPAAKEAIAFAVLGYETLRGRTANLPRATGARRAVALGAIAPFELSGLLAALRRECELA